MAISNPQYETLVSLYRRGLLSVNRYIPVVGVRFRLEGNYLVLRVVREIEGKRIGIFSYGGDATVATEPINGAVLLEPGDDNKVAVVPLIVITSGERVVYFGRSSYVEYYRKI